MTFHENLAKELAALSLRKVVDYALSKGVTMRREPAGFVLEFRGETRHVRFLSDVRTEIDQMCR